MKLENKVAIVTAATRGIGFSTSIALAKEGARVYMAVRRVEDTVDLVKEYKERGLELIPIYYDAYDFTSYEILVKNIMKIEDKIDILVNNFGKGNPPKDLDVVRTDIDDFLEIIQSNVGSIFKLCKEVIPYMKNGGSIVNLSSVGGTVPDVVRVGYGVSKAAINNLTLQIATQYANKNIRCNAILPGIIETDAIKNNMSQQFQDLFLKHVPLGRMGQVEDISNAVIFFASNDSSYITGNIMEVAGGFGIPSALYGDYKGI